MTSQTKLYLVHLVILSLSTVTVHLYDPTREVFCAANGQCAGELRCVEGLCSCPSGHVAQSGAQADCPKCVPFACSEDAQCANVFRDFWHCVADYYNCSCEGAPGGETIHEPSSTRSSIASIASRPSTCTFKPRFNTSRVKRMYEEQQQQQADARWKRRQNDFLSETFFAMIVWGFGVVIIGMLLVSIMVDRLKQCIYPNHKLIKEYSLKP